MTSLLPNMSEPFLSQQAVINWISCQPNWCEICQGVTLPGLFEIPRMTNLRISEDGFHRLRGFWYSDSIKRPEPLTGSELLTLGRMLQSPWWLNRRYNRVELHCFSRRAHMEWALMDHNLTKWMEFRKPVDSF
jgi:hypothetical protein